MWFFSVFLFTVVLCQCHGEDDSGQTKGVYPLPGTTVPESYDLTLYPHFRGANDSTFTGKTKITVTAISTTDTVTLNVEHLLVTDVTVTDVTDVTRPPQSLAITRYYHNDYLQFHIVLDRPLTTGQKCEVTISYEGTIRTDNVGLYMSTYVESGVTKYMVVTQLEPIDARKVFPCYDEPSYKAVFNITVIKDKHLTAVSNMPVFSIEDGPTNGTETVHFVETPRMSSYLVAIYVGEFVPNKNGSKITIYTHADHVNQTEYVWTEAAKHLSFMEDYTGIDYALPKLDLVVLMGPFTRAMENWGMNVFHDINLSNTTSKTKFILSSLITVQHEFAHQWFGNLVTCSKWDYTWLNEAFATYFGYIAAGILNPDWKNEELFMTEVFYVAIIADSFEHSLTESVSTPKEIKNQFGITGYQKGASILRMLKHIVTEDLFQRSLRKYLNTNSYKAVTPTDLYASFDSILFDSNYTLANELSIAEFMSNWTTQVGYPILHIKKNETSNTFNVTQTNAASQYLKNSSAFCIGLTYTTESTKNFNDTRPSIWTDEISKTTIIPAPPNSGWYIFNIQSTGFYRVTYDDNNWIALIKQLNEDPNAIHVLNRIQLIYEIFNLVSDRKLNYSVPMQLLKYFEKENSVTPWYIARRYFDRKMMSMRNSEEYYIFKAYVRRLASIIYKKVNDLVTNGNSNFYILRAWDTFSTWACSLGDKGCLKNALEYFKKWYSGEKISPDIKDAAFCAGLKYNTEPETFTRLLHLYKTTKSNSEKNSVLTAFACSSNKTQIIEYINIILDEPKTNDKVPNFFEILHELSFKLEGVDVLCDFLSANSNGTLDKRLGIPETAEKIYFYLTKSFNTERKIEKMRLLTLDPAIPVSTRNAFNQSFTNINQTVPKTQKKVTQWILDNFEIFI